MALPPGKPSYGFVHVRLPADQYAALRAEAERQRSGMATVVRQALDLLLKTRQT